MKFYLLKKLLFLILILEIGLFGFLLFRETKKTKILFEKESINLIKIIKKEKNPKLISRYQPISAEGVFVSGNYIYLAVKDLTKGNLAFQNLPIKNAGFLQIIKYGN